MTTRRARFAVRWIAAPSHSVAACSQARRRRFTPGHGGHRILRRYPVCCWFVRPCRLPAPRPPSFSANFSSTRPFSLLADARSAASTPAEAGMHHGAQRYCTGTATSRGAREGPSMPSLWKWFGHAFGARLRSTGIAGPPTLAIAL
jgi:hypothetical protein